MHEKPVVKGDSREAAQASPPAKGSLGNIPAGSTTSQEDERKIDEIVKRHRETLERLA